MELLLRIEDLDGPRVKPESTQQCVDTLTWLGLEHDGSMFVQSHDLEPYKAAMMALTAKRMVYRCDLTRKEIEQAVTAPHAGDHESCFPPELRPDAPADVFEAQDESNTWAFIKEDTNYRLCVPDEIITIHDELMGDVKLYPFREVGDFVVWTKRGVPAYQLAVVVDDARQGVTHVIRGDDLLPSAARQELIYRALDLTPPMWMHLPLVLGPDGRRLAKRHGDTRIDHYRNHGATAERIIGLLAFWSGVSANRIEMSAHDFLARFDLDTLPRCPITFTQDDDAWLLSRS